MARRRLPLIVLLVGVLGAASAAGAAASVEEPPVPPAIADLRRVVEAEIEFLTAPAPLADDDLEAMLGTRAARADFVSGSARVAAAERIAWLFAHHDLDVVELLVAGPRLLRELADEGEPPARLDLLRAARRWESLERSRDRLIRLVGERAPERVCPVDGETWFTNDWHDSRPGGRVHLGIDLHGQIGTPLLAAESGTVIQANWHWAGGRQVFIRADTTGDVYFYAHLHTWSEWIWTGTRVEAGDVIGTLGRSGNATTPHLHFGWMPGAHGLDLGRLSNPYPLLVEWCD